MFGLIFPTILEGAPGVAAWRDGDDAAHTVLRQEGGGWHRWQGQGERFSVKVTCWTMTTGACGCCRPPKVVAGS
jgi:hypothetical protein